MADLDAYATIFVAAVALVSLALAVLTYIAYRRTRHRRVLFVVAAMSVLFGKSALAAYALGTETIPHEHLEVIQGGFDLLMVGLLAAPFLMHD